MGTINALAAARKALPIKILGFPRSGTSLLQRLLAGHPQVWCPPETYVFSGCARMIREARGEGPDLGMVTGLMFAGFPEDEIVDRVRNFGLAFLDEGAARAGKEIWADKSSFDIFDLAEIETLLSGRCRFICVVRNPLDVVASMNELIAQMGQNPPQLRSWMARHENYHVAWAAAWADTTRQMLDLHSRLGDQSLLYRYERLTADSDAMLARIAAFAGLEPFAHDSRPDTGQVGLGDWKIFETKGVSQSSVERWRRNLPRSSAADVLDVVGALMDELGYERPVIRAPRTRAERVTYYQRSKLMTMDRRDKA